MTDKIVVRDLVKVFESRMRELGRVTCPKCVE
jgi:hypothetical protein